jgi:16S rRNA C1402 (ribose-2'-O) methylase RsmI
MDTPYRMGRLLSELAERFPARRVLLGCDFTQESETVVEAFARDVPQLIGDRKAEFILILYPGESEAPKAVAPSASLKRDSRPSQTRNGPSGRKFTPGRKR